MKQLFNVEIITRKSTLDDIIDSWVAAGKPGNRDDGKFVFENCSGMNVDHGTIEIIKDDVYYYYNMKDFYRVKVVELIEEEL